MRQAMPIDEEPSASTAVAAPLTGLPAYPLGIMIEALQIHCGDVIQQDREHEQPMKRPKRREGSEPGNRCPSLLCADAVLL
jgi:hypothetical protein